jgi:cytoskeleton protein RodZ
MSKVTQISLEEGGEISRKRIHLREISGDLDAALETVGQDLRAARLRRGDDLATASRALKIRKDYLEALEEDRIEALPGRTYAVGFVRTYADYLGLDAVQCVERYKAEIAGRTEEKEPPPYADEAEERHLPYGWMIVGVIVLLLVIYGAYHLAISADSVANQPVAAVPAQMEPKAENSTATAASRPPKPAPTTGAQNLNLATPPTAMSGQPATGAPGTTALPGSTAPTGAPATATTPQGHVYGELNPNPRVILRATKVTKVLVMGPGQRTFINRVLNPGDTYRVPNVVGMTLTTPDGSGIEVDLDGQAMGNAGRTGQMVDALSLNPQSVVDRYSGGHG